MKKAICFVLFAACLLSVGGVRATTYYVDHTNGSDSNNGLSKATPWKSAPGMLSCSGVCSATTVNPGDNVILKGCVAWPNASFPWQFPFAGANGNPIYIGVDKTWWDNTVSGCASSWNRPVMNPGATMFGAAGELQRMIIVNQSFVTYDNFEIKNVLAADGPANHETHAFDLFTGTNDIVENMYIHQWVNPCFSVGTATVTSGSFTITNFTPLSYSPLPTGCSASSGQSRLQMVAGASIPLGNSCPTLTGLSGSNPYTLTFSCGAGAASSSCSGSGCIVQVGADFFIAFAGTEYSGNNPTSANTNVVLLNDVVDGSDTVEALLNPNMDCGLSSSNNNLCLSSGQGVRHGPQIVRGCVFRYLEAALVGSAQEWSNNLIEAVRLSTDPTSHTNGVEVTNEAGNSLYFNNVFRHTNNPNPSTPTGRNSIGLSFQPSPVAGFTDYIFNNVFYDSLQNYTFETGSSVGTVKLFNNTMDCGPEWSLTFGCANPPNGSLVGNSQNNLYITGSATPVPGWAENTDLVMTPSAANSSGYTATQTYAYSPTSSSSRTMATGASISSLCAAVSAVNTPAGNACLNDSTYGAAYNTSAHVAISPNRATVVRPAAPGIGALLYSGLSTGTPPAAPTAVVGIGH